MYCFRARGSNAKYFHLKLFLLFSDLSLLEEMFSFACPKFITPSAPNYDAAPAKYHRVRVLDITG